MRLALLAVVWMLPSCATSEVPLSDPNTARPDQRLAGSWRIGNYKKNGAGYVFTFIGKPERKELPAGLMKMIMVDDHGDGTIKATEVFFLTTSLGEGSYISLLCDQDVDRVIAPKWDKGQIKEWFILKYAVEPDRIRVWALDDDCARAAIRDGKVKGSIGQHGWLALGSSRFTDAEDLRRYLLAGGDQFLFPATKGPIELVRVR
jgi:hypothetical protein